MFNKESVFEITKNRRAYFYVNTVKFYGLIEKYEEDYIVINNSFDDKNHYQVCIPYYSLIAIGL
jgi:hypothetical protein